MALKFVDFKAEQSFFTIESEDSVLTRVNAWLEEQRVTPFNVETLLEGGGSLSVTFTGFRVWYQS